MAYIMNINIQADEDIQYILRNIKKSDTGAYVFMSDNRESLINIFCEILRDINETIYTSNKNFVVFFFIIIAYFPEVTKLAISSSKLTIFFIPCCISDIVNLISSFSVSNFMISTSICSCVIIEYYLLNIKRKSQSPKTQALCFNKLLLFSHHVNTIDFILKVKNAVYLN
jgi:hypothetical protein